jgi:hypothetical protein
MIEFWWAMPALLCLILVGGAHPTLFLFEIELMIQFSAHERMDRREI